MPALAEALTPLLPDHYIARTDQDVFIRERSADERVGVSGATDGSSVVAAFPATAVDIERRPFIQIVDRRQRAVVIAIEVLSPSNKSPSGDRATYLAKRRRLLSAGANLVEVDLLRGGPRLPLEGLPPCDYYDLVSRAADWPAVRVWPLTVRDPLPVIPIPLASGENDVWLDLRVAFDRVYDGAGYARYTYAADPELPFTPADGAWATDRLMAARGGRGHDCPSIW